MIKTIATSAVPVILLCGLLAARPGSLQAQAVATPQKVQEQPATVAPVQSPPALQAIDVKVYGRIEKTSGGMYPYQWPGTYFETAFHGTELYFRIGEGRQDLHVTVDGQLLPPVLEPRPGLYRINAATTGDHTVRIDAVNENQDAPKSLGAFAVSPGEHGLEPPSLSRQVEFIGDSHTVGYGNTSASHECTVDQVWRTTDTSQSLGADVARHYNANYRIEAISGHGVVRNYDGSPGDPVPVAYPFLFLDKKTPVADSSWHPSVIAISLGTNDFSTPLKPAEAWKSRDDLHVDYERTYVAFVHSLRRRNPEAVIVLWSTDLANGEIAAEVAKVAETLETAGDRRVVALEVTGLAFTGCHGHPSVEDDRTIARRLVETIDQQHVAW